MRVEPTVVAQDAQLLNLYIDLASGHSEEELSGILWRLTILDLSTDPNELLELGKFDVLKGAKNTLIAFTGDTRDWICDRHRDGYLGALPVNDGAKAIAQHILDAMKQAGKIITNNGLFAIGVIANLLSIGGLNWLCGPKDQRRVLSDTMCYLAPGLRPIAPITQGTIVELKEAVRDSAGHEWRLAMAIDTKITGWLPSSLLGPVQ